MARGSEAPRRPPRRSRKFRASQRGAQAHGGQPWQPLLQPQSWLPRMGRARRQETKCAAMGARWCEAAWRLTAAAPERWFRSSHELPCRCKPMLPPLPYMGRGTGVQGRRRGHQWRLSSATSSPRRLSAAIGGPSQIWKEKV